MPLKPCLRCGVLSTGSYCPRHAPSRFNKAKRGSGWQASRFRARVLAQTGGACAVCGSREGVEAPHLGATDEQGGVPLCSRCHLRAERRVDRTG